MGFKLNYISQCNEDYKSKWFDVSKELPLWDNPVLVLFEIGIIGIGVIDRENQKLKPAYNGVAIDKKFWLTMKQVAWMSLVSNPIKTNMIEIYEIL